METKFICGTISDRGVAVYAPIFFLERYLLTSLALRGNMFYRRAVAGLSLERCQLSES